MPQHVAVSDGSYSSPSVYPTPTTAGAEAGMPEDREWRTDMATANLSKALGELKIDHTGVCMQATLPNCVSPNLIFSSPVHS